MAELVIDSGMADQMSRIRQDLHAHPELGMQEVRTSEIIARHLAELGFTVIRGLAKTGVVASLSCGTGRRSIGLRADMDALPIAECTGLPYASRAPGVMHACGHDGHVATLLGAARAIVQRRKFDGTVHLIFQPAEENLVGAKVMVEAGLFRRCPCDAVFALHNDPRLAFGKVALRNGPIMAAEDEVRILLQGRGGHGGYPHQTSDPIVAGASIVMALQTIVSRNIDPSEPCVVTIGAFHSGTASNVIPGQAELTIGVRSHAPEVRDRVQVRLHEIVEAQARSFGISAQVRYARNYEMTVNHATETDFVRSVVAQVLGPDRLVELTRPSMAAEDFGFMLAAVPGCFFFLGSARTNGDPPLHHPAFDYNDMLLPAGAELWTKLVEAWLPCA